MEDKTTEHVTQNNTTTTIEEGKTMALIAYITIFGLLIAYITNNDKKNPFTAYHIRQSLGLGLTGIALMIVNWLPYIGWLIGMIGGIALLVLWVLGLVNAINGKEEPIPVVGSYFEQWFKNI